MTSQTLMASVLLALGCVMASCVSDRNERLAIGTHPTASFAPAGPAGAAGAGEPDRRRWRTTVVVAPIDGVVHPATLRTEKLAGRRADAVEAGVFPTIESVTGGRSRGDLRPGLDELGRVMLDPLFSPLRTTRAWRGGWWTWSPIAVWKRTPAARVRPGTIGAVREVNDHE